MPTVKLYLDDVNPIKLNHQEDSLDIVLPGGKSIVVFGDGSVIGYSKSGLIETDPVDMVAKIKKAKKAEKDQRALDYSSPMMTAPSYWSTSSQF